MPLEMVGTDESICMAKNQSYVMRIATEFQVKVPGRCFELLLFRRRRSRIRTVDCQCAEYNSDQMYKNDQSNGT